MSTSGLLGEIRQVAFGPEKAPLLGQLMSAGWLPCDGMSLRQDEYRQLFATIGLSWGSEDQNHTFLIPDFSGVFLRGVSLNPRRLDGREGDLGKDSRGSARPDLGELGPPNDAGAVGKRVGSFQEHGLKSHTHYYQNNPEQGAVVTQGPASGMNRETKTEETEAQVGGAPETRPTNCAIMHVIFVGTVTPADQARVVAKYRGWERDDR